MKWSEHAVVPYIGGGRLRFAPPAPAVGVTPWEWNELRAKVCGSPHALMALKLPERMDRRLAASEAAQA